MGLAPNFNVEALTRGRQALEAEALFERLLQAYFTRKALFCKRSAHEFRFAWNSGFKSMP